MSASDVLWSRVLLFRGRFKAVTAMDGGNAAGGRMPELSMARYAWTSLSTQSSEQQYPAPNHSYVILSLSKGKEKQQQD
jgi:hypothetical protein